MCWYQRRHDNVDFSEIDALNHKSAIEIRPPHTMERDGGGLAANRDATDTEIQAAPEESRSSVMANLAWVVDTGAAFDTVPLGYAQQEAFATGTLG